MRQHDGLPSPNSAAWSMRVQTVAFDDLRLETAFCIPA